MKADLTPDVRQLSDFIFGLLVFIAIGPKPVTYFALQNSGRGQPPRT